MPLAGASIHLHGDNNGSRNATTGSDGSYRFAGVIVEGFVLTAGRQTIAQCSGSGTFTGTMNWQQLTIAAPQVVFPCASPYTNVTLSIARQH